MVTGPPGDSADDAPATTRALAPGTVVADRYRVEELLGEGGMGAVYRAEHVHMRKQVAIKVLHPAMSSTEEIVTRFEREAVAAGNISHPNVAAATDFGKLDDGSFFLVLEYVAGRSLRSLLHEEKKLDAARALRIVHQVAAALGAAHAKGVVHRDLKPENVMLVQRDKDDELVKVLDFGIAKIDVDSVGTAGAPSASASAQPLTRIGSVFGTPDYMAPEQAIGQAVDARADLYSIGVMLFEMLVGERPYRGGTVTVLRQHVLHDIPELPDEVATKVDARVGPLLRDLLAKTPETRVQSAQELQDRIAPLLTQPGPPAPPSSARAVAVVGHLPTAVAGSVQSAGDLAAVSAPTAMALEGSPGAPAVVLNRGEAAAPSAPSNKPSPKAIAAVAGGALLLGILLVVVLFASRSGDGVVAAASASSHVDPGVVLPPPPEPASHVAAAKEAVREPTTKEAPAKDASSAASNVAEVPTADTAGGGDGTAGSSSGGGGHGKSHGKEKEGRKTGPGGIYIPPPKTWFN